MTELEKKSVRALVFAHLKDIVEIAVGLTQTCAGI